MDLGCIDMGCLDKPRKEASLQKDHTPTESVMSASKPGKNNKAKEVVRSSLNALNKLTSQISKPRQTSSPVNWFPRRKTEPYLERKIKMLQEVDGMHLTLDETLGDSNPHYSKILREKIAIREAAEKAMEARKTAMVEASWCRILQAARIETKEAEAQLTKAEQSAAEAFEAARAVGVIVNDSQNNYRIETSSTTSHTVSATFESAFEVDKQVAGAVKAALIKLVNCPSINKDEFKELLHRISENPETSENFNDMSDFALGCELGIVDMMLGRIRCLKEDELASLATIVATSGLSAALSSEVGNNSKRHSLSSPFEDNGNNATCPPKVVLRRMSSVSGRSAKNQNADLPSLDKFLVKHLTRLEREVLEAKNARKDEVVSLDGIVNDKKNLKEGTEIETPDLGSVLMRKQVHKGRAKQDIEEVPSLDKYLVKHLTKLERELEEARDRKTSEPDGIESVKDKENIDVNETEIQNYESLDKVLVKHVSRLEREKTNFREDDQMSSKPKQKNTNGGLAIGECSLDQILVKRVSRLEREKMDFLADEEMRRNLTPKNTNEVLETSEGSLDQVLVKRISKLEREKMDFCADEEMSSKPKRKNTTEGLETSEGSLDQVLVKRVSRLEREKRDFRANEEMRRNLTPKNTNEVLETSEGSLDQVLGKRVSKLEREKMDFRADEEMSSKPKRKNTNEGLETSEGSLDQVLVKRISRLEREKRDFRANEEMRRNLTPKNTNEVLETSEGSLDQVLVKRVSKLEREKMDCRADEEMSSKPKRKNTNEGLETSEGSLDQVLVKRISRLEREKMDEEMRSKPTRKNLPSLESSEGSLDQVLVKHKSRLEREKMGAVEKREEKEDGERHSFVSRRQAREKELQSAWGGLSLENSMSLHISKLQRDKDAWIEAEEAERKRETMCADEV